MPEMIPDEQWSVYRRVIDGARTRGLRFALGGGLAVSTYTGRWRNTKDLDLYIRPQDREAMVETLRRAGLSDYYEQLPYDRNWIFRGYRDGTIVDVIWSLANYRAQVDEAWVTRGPEVIVRGERLRLLPPEEAIWSKLHVLQRDRCDWPDVLNLIYAVGPTLDWEHLLGRVGEDAPLLSGLLSVFTWLCPGRAQELPSWLWKRLRLPDPPNPAPEVDRRRVNLLDSRPWFSPTLEGDEAK